MFSFFYQLFLHTAFFAFFIYSMSPEGSTELTLLCLLSWSWLTIKGILFSYGDTTKNYMAR